VTQDHYATLGLAPTTEDDVVRAAYLALMRRYHPDIDRSPGAAERARAITLAYEVLGNREKRATYDRLRNHEGPGETPTNLGSWRRRQTILTLLGAAALMLSVVFITADIPYGITQPEKAPTALIGGSAASLAEIDPAPRCSSAATSDLIKREFLRRAASLRGSNGNVLERINGQAAVRIDSAVLTRTGAKGQTISCTASVSLDLPPGMAVAGGTRTLRGKISYAVDSDNGQQRLALLSEALIERLATVTHDTDRLAEAVDERRPVEEVVKEDVRTSAQEARSARSSRDKEARTRPMIHDTSTKAISPCRSAKSLAAAAICSDKNIAALDRQMTILHNQAQAHADAPKRALLFRSQHDFVARLERCSSKKCIRSVYLDRMRQTWKIMSVPPPAR
jgi:hypothetical protein